MGFNVKPEMPEWNNMSENYKKEYHVYAVKMERRKFENDRKIAKMTKKKKKQQKMMSKEFSKNASAAEKKWFGWMDV